MNKTEDEKGEQDCSEKTAPKKSPYQRFTIPKPILKIIWAVLVEFAIILWISAEFFSQFFSGIASTKIAVWLLGLSLVLCFSYIAHKLLGAKGVPKYRSPIYCFTVIGCLLVLIGCCFAISAINRKWKAENEPRVIPALVEVHKGKYDLISRVLISNPSDSWIYKVILLIQPENNSVSIDSIKTFLSDPQSPDKFTRTVGGSEPNPPKEPDFAITDSVGFDVVVPQVSSGRLMILYSLAPREQRALWIRGIATTNCFAKISIVEYSKTPLTLIAPTNGTVVWMGPAKNSIFWKYFPKLQPLDLSFVAQQNVWPLPTNNARSFGLPSRK